MRYINLLLILTNDIDAGSAPPPHAIPQTLLSGEQRNPAKCGHKPREIPKCLQIQVNTRMWANAQRDGRPAYYYYSVERRSLADAHC